MHKIQQERRRELAASFVELLRKMEMGTTADVLAQEADLGREKDVEQDIRDIIEDGRSTQRERGIAIETYCKYSIVNYLRQGKIDEALQIYEIIVPLHCPHKIEEFSLLFAGNYENDKRGVAMLLEGFLEKPNVLPEKRLSFLSIGNDIRFMKLLGKGMLMIDCHNNAVVVENSQVKYRREKLHSEKIFAVAVGEGEIFATGGLDKVVKIWDCKINLLSTVELHRARINTLLLYDRNLIIFDQNAIISVHELEGSALKPSRRAVFKTTSPFLDTKYAKSKKKIIGITYAQGKGQINIVNIAKKRIQKIVEIDKRIYLIELSIDDKMVFANVAPAEIRAYSLTAKHELMYKFTGFVQEKNMMRMSQGGRDGKYLAVTSEEGSVRIYSIREEEEVLRLMGESKKSINCVLWKEEHLFFACDAGNLEHWGNLIKEQRVQSKPKKRILSVEEREHEIVKGKKIHVS